VFIVAQPLLKLAGIASKVSLREQSSYRENLLAGCEIIVVLDDLDLHSA
jgi:hypothetical protein